MEEANDTGLDFSRINEVPDDLTMSEGLVIRRFVVGASTGELAVGEAVGSGLLEREVDRRYCYVTLLGEETMFSATRSRGDWKALGKASVRDCLSAVHREVPSLQMPLEISVGGPNLVRLETIRQATSGESSPPHVRGYRIRGDILKGDGGLPALKRERLKSICAILGEEQPTNLKTRTRDSKWKASVQLAYIPRLPRAEGGLQRALEMAREAYAYFETAPTDCILAPARFIYGRAAVFQAGQKRGMTKRLK